MGWWRPETCRGLWHIIKKYYKNWHLLVIVNIINWKMHGMKNLKPLVTVFSIHLQHVFKDVLTSLRPNWQPSVTTLTALTTLTRTTKRNVQLVVRHYEIRNFPWRRDYSKWPCDSKLALPTLSSFVMQPLSRSRSLQQSGVLLHKFRIFFLGGIARNVWYVPWFTSDLPRKFFDKIKIGHDSSCRYPVLPFDAADI